MKKEKHFEGIAKKPEAAPIMNEPMSCKEESVKNAPGSDESIEAFNGELNLRLPKSLHLQLKEEAKAEGVTVTEYILYKLTR